MCTVCKPVELLLYTEQLVKLDRTCGLIALSQTVTLQLER